MKNLLLFFSIVLFSGTIEAQSNLPQEHITVIANIVDGQAKSANYALSDLRIESKIERIIKLGISNIKLVNPTITNEGQRGWFIQYEFNSEGYVGIYKERLRLRHKQLVITESRSARIGVSTNCEEIQFTNDENHCKCVKKKSVDFEPAVTYRVFTSIN